MITGGVHGWLFARTWVRRALLAATTDADRTRTFLGRYLRCSAAFRIAFILLLPVFFAWLMTKMGSWWPVGLGLGLVCVFHWRRILGCQVLDKKVVNTIGEIVRSDPHLNHADWKKVVMVETMDDWRVVVQVLDCANRAQAQAVVLQEDTESSSPSRPSPRL